MELRIPPPIQTIFWGFLMWCTNRYISISLDIPDYTKALIYIPLIILAVILLTFALVSFIKQKTTVTPLNPQKSTSIVHSGVYAFSRNPMYLGMGMLLAAWFVWLANPANIIFMVGFVWYMNRFQIIPEERILTEKFGEPYTSYCESVRRWI